MKINKNYCDMASASCNLMKKHTTNKFLPTLLFLSTAIFLCFSTNFQSFECIETNEFGIINWTHKYFESSGSSSLDTSFGNIASNELLTMKKAEENGLNNLTSLISKVLVDSQTTVIDLVKKDPVISLQISQYVSNAQISDVKYDNINRTIKYKLPFLLSKSSVYAALNFYRDYNIKVTKKSSFPHTSVFSSIIIDCRGFKIKPSLKPKIYVDNNVFLFFDNLTWEAIIKRGYITFLLNISNIKALKPLIGENPYMISAIGSYGIYNTDIIISDEDLNFIIGNPENKSLLENGYIFVIIDKF